jgi:uncharacterized protein (TIGR03000 family)
MKTASRITLCFLVLIGFSTWNVAQEKAVSTLTIIVPERGQEETVLKINGKVVDGEGTTRTYKANVEKGKEYKYTIYVDIEPNNYTHIYRTKEITFKGGDNVKVDMTVKNPKTDKIKVRWVPTPDDIVDEMCKLGKITKDDVIYDLGCGDAVMLIRPFKKFGAKKGVGIDIDPKMVKIAKEKVKEAKLEGKIEIRQGDILNVKDMADATLVLIYIGDDLGERVGPVLQKTMKPGARIVSHRFILGDWTPTKSVTVKGEDGSEYELHLWVVGEQKKKTNTKVESK